VAARIPDGTTVTIATHNDADGEQCARDITKTLALHAGRLTHPSTAGQPQ